MTWHPAARVTARTSASRRSPTMSRSIRCSSRAGEKAAGTRSADLAFTALPVGLAEDELLELAGGGAGERRPELDRRRALEVGQPLAAEVDELRLGHRMAVA